MKMTRIALSLALMATLFAGSGVAVSFAQDAPGAAAGQSRMGGHHGHKKMDKAQWEAKRKEMKERFAKELNLTEEQQAKIEVIRKNFREAHKADFEAMKANRQEMMELKKSSADKEALKAKRESFKPQFEAMRADRKRMMEEIKAVLTPEQVAKLEAMKQQHMQKRGERRGHGGGQAQQ